MKKQYLIVYFAFSLLCFILISNIINVNVQCLDSINAIEENIEVEVDDETLELANAVVNKLVDKHVYSIGLACPEESYYRTAQWVAPELELLEKKENAASALLKIYENMLVEFREFDNDSYLEIIKNEDKDGKDELYSKGMELHTKRETLEGIFAHEGYFDSLSKKEKNILCDYFEEFAAIDYSSELRVFNEGMKVIYFYAYQKTCKWVY